MKIKFIYIFLAITAFILKCANSNSTTNMIIKGNLKNLPDGTMFLIGSTFDKKKTSIDSANTKDGQFNFVLVNNNLSQLLTLEHNDKNGVKREFSFKTNRTYNGGPWLSEYFMADDTILINANLADFLPKGLKLPSNIRLVYPDQPIKAGKQTYVLYNVTYDFNQPVTDSSMDALGKIIRQYSYSYYLINEINSHRNSFTKKQLTGLLSLFDEEVQQGDIAGSLKESLQFRGNKNFNTVSFLDKDYEAKRLKVNNKKITMVVLWASWCMPCREEIPILKEIYKQFSTNPDFQMLSISLDAKKEDWQEALTIEKMPWQQLLIPDNLQIYTNEIFKFNGLIPTTIFIDNSGTEISKLTGYDKNLLESYRKLISRHLKK